MATPIWLVLAAAQFFLLTGFGKGPMGFVPSEHGLLRSPEAWSKAVHQAAAESIMGNTVPERDMEERFAAGETPAPASAEADGAAEQSRTVHTAAIILVAD